LRWLLVALLTLLALLQYRLWFADGSLAERHRLKQQIEEQARVNRQLQQRNAVLEREVLELQSGNRGLEQRAREQLGLIREGETFYQFAEPAAARPGLPANPLQPPGGPADPEVAPALVDPPPREVP
jgi:cell division protein FtsB